jgi:ribosomal protein S18 acetylase RimI-like enzyme
VGNAELLQSQTDQQHAGNEMNDNTDSLTIRPYHFNDEVKVVFLVRELQEHESSFFDRLAAPHKVGSWYLAHILREARQNGGELIVAELDGRIVGYATLLLGQTSEGSFDEMPYTYAVIGDLIVTESARTQGVGAALLREGERLARAAGERWLRVNVFAGNERALQVYRRFGFAEHVIEMEKPLG